MCLYEIVYACVFEYIYQIVYRCTNEISIYVYVRVNFSVCVMFSRDCVKVCVSFYGVNVFK